jgi:hypothetical protein
MTAGATAGPRLDTTVPSYVHESLSWRRSTYSAGTNCVEVAIAKEVVLVRDSRSLDNGQVLTASLSSWQAFLNKIREQEF